jgi:hypothetical protein
MSGEGVYRVAIWAGGRGDNEHPWGRVFYVETDRWCPLETTPPCTSDEQVISEARSVAKVLARKAMPDESYVWRTGSPNRDGAFEHEGRPLAAPYRIEDLGIRRSSLGSI